MKKLLVCIFATIPFFSFSQIEKGSTMIAGRLDFLSAYQKTSPSSSISNTSIGAQVGIFRFASQRFGYGLDGGVVLSSYKYNYAAPIVDTSTTALSVNISPSLGFFIPLSAERTYFTFIASYKFSLDNVGRSPGNDLIGYSNSASIAPGVLYFFNPNIGISAQLALASKSIPTPQLAVHCLLNKKN